MNEVQFKKRLKKRVGEGHYDILIERLGEDGIDKVIDFAEANDLSLDQAVMTAVNFHMPPNLNISIDLRGVHPDDQHVIDHAIALINHIRENINDEVVGADIVSTHPYFTAALSLSVCNNHDEDDDDHVCGEEESEDPWADKMQQIFDNS